MVQDDPAQNLIYDWPMRPMNTQKAFTRLLRAILKSASMGAMLPYVTRAGVMMMPSWLAVILDTLILFIVRLKQIHADVKTHTFQLMIILYITPVIYYILLGGIALTGLAQTTSIGVDNVICPENVTRPSDCSANIPPVSPRCSNNLSAAGIRCIQGNIKNADVKFFND